MPLDCTGVCDLFDLIEHDERRFIEVANDEINIAILEDIKQSRERDRAVERMMDTYTHGHSHDQPTPLCQYRVQGMH